MHPPGRQCPGFPPVEPAEPGHHVPGVGAASARRPQPSEPRGHQDLLALLQLGDHGDLRPYPAQQLDRYRRRAGAQCDRGEGYPQSFKLTWHGRMVAPGTDILADGARVIQRVITRSAVSSA